MAAPPGPRPVLVVDDDLDTLEAMRDTFEQEGYPIIVHNDGRAALAYVRSHPAPAVIFLDWNMRPMNGDEFMRELEQDPGLSDLPVVLVTADLRVEVEARRWGFVTCLRKPVDLDLMFALVERYCTTG